jgi:predicted DNA-binding protein
MVVKSSVEKSKSEKLEAFNIQIDLPKKLENYLEHLVKISGQPKEFIVYEAIVRYIEELKDIQKLSVWEALGLLDEDRKKYTSEEAGKRLEELRISK